MLVRFHFKCLCKKIPTVAVFTFHGVLIIGKEQLYNNKRDSTSFSVALYENTVDELVLSSSVQY